MTRFRAVVVLVIVILALLFGFYYNKQKHVSVDGNPASVGAKPTAGAPSYTCPMHPFVIKDKPGSCPICAMEMVRKIEGVNLDSDLKGKQHVALSPAQQVMANLATVTVERKAFSKEIDCTGIVAYNQERQGKVSAWVAGRLDRLHTKSVGSEVRKGVPVAELFSVDLYNAQVQYLLAYKTIKILNNTPSVPFPVNTQNSLGEAHERLRQLGFREEQFDKLQKSASPNVHVPLSSAISGFVTEIFVKEGQYVNVGEPLFSIADLSRIWVELEVFENDFPLIRVGQNVTIRSRSYPSETFNGKIKLVYPFLDPKTRTVRIRVELPNPGLKLKPEMFVQATIKIPLADALVVPVGAVMDTGKRQVVWVESRPGLFLPRDVKAGTRSGTGVQILSGLNEGEKIAATGGYLIDSEAQLSRVGETPESSSPAQDRSSGKPAKKADMDMNDMKMK